MILKQTLACIYLNVIHSLGQSVGRFMTHFLGSIIYTVFVFSALESATKSSNVRPLVCHTQRNRCPLQIFVLLEKVNEVFHVFRGALSEKPP